MVLYYNVIVYLVLVLANAGRHDWVYDWGALALWLNAIPFIYAMVRHRCRFHGRGPIFWGGAMILPWTAFSVLFIYSLFNANFFPFFSNLFSPLEFMDFNERLPTTPNPERSRMFIQFLIGLLFMTGALLTCRLTGQQIRRSLYVLFFFGSGFALIGSLMRLTETELFLWTFEFREPAAFATFFYKNHGAYFCLLSAGIGCGLIHSTWRREGGSGHFPEKTVSLVALTFLCFTAIPLANARGATLVGLPLFLAFIASLGLLGDFGARARRFQVSLAVAALLLGGGYLAVSGQIDKDLQRSERQIELVRGQGLTAIGRPALYRDTLSIIRDRPVWGWGIGSFIHIHPIYAGPEFYRNDSNYPVAYEFAHSDVLQMVCEMGYLGTALLLGPFFAIFIALVGKVNWSPRRFACWLVGSAALVAVTALFDFPLSAPAIALGMLLCGMVGLRHGLTSAKKT